MLSFRPTYKCFVDYSHKIHEWDFCARLYRAIEMETLSHAPLPMMTERQWHDIRQPRHVDFEISEWFPDLKSQVELVRARKVAVRVADACKLSRVGLILDLELAEFSVLSPP